MFQALTDLITPLYEQHKTLSLLSLSVLGGTVLLLGRRYFAGRFVPKSVWKKANLTGQVVLVTGASREAWALKVQEPST